jgi:Lon protease-like protein
MIRPVALLRSLQASKFFVPEFLTLSSLPLFPLQTVLFPEGVLALRVFEVRYLDMVRRCHEADAPFGVVALKHGSEVRQAGATPEAFHTIGTLARIRALDTPHGLWVADILQLDNDLTVPVPSDLAYVAQALIRVFESLRMRPGTDGRILPVSGPVRWNDCGWLANRWCELLPIPRELKQRLMQLDNPLVRLELVSDILQRMGISV